MTTTDHDIITRIEQRMDEHEKQQRLRMDTHENRQAARDVDFARLQGKVDSLATHYDYRFSILESKVDLSSAVLAKVGWVNFSTLLTLIGIAVTYFLGKL